MKVVCETHLFGSRGGYRSIAASPGLADAERSELEIFGFGQLPDRAAQDRLRRRPGAFGRRLASGRFAITRILPGPDDDGGRPTLELRSILLDSRAYRVAAGRLAAVLADEAIWSSEAFARGAPVAVDPGSSAAVEATPLHRRVADAWVSIRDRRAKVIRIDRDATVLDLAGLLGPQDLAEYRWGVGLLSTAVPADVVTTAEGVSPSGRRAVIECGTSGPWRHPQLQHLPDHGPWPPLGLTIRGPAGNAMSREPIPVATTETAVVSRGRPRSGWRMPILASAAVLAIAAGVLLVLALKGPEVEDPTLVAAAPPRDRQGAPPADRRERPELPESDSEEETSLNEQDPNSGSGTPEATQKAEAGASAVNDRADQQSSSNDDGSPGRTSSRKFPTRRPAGAQRVDDSPENDATPKVDEPEVDDASSERRSESPEAETASPPTPSQVPRCDCPSDVLSIRLRDTEFEYSEELQELRDHIKGLQVLLDQVTALETKSADQVTRDLRELHQKSESISNYFIGLTDDPWVSGIPGLQALTELENYFSGSISTIESDEGNFIATVGSIKGSLRDLERDWKDLAHWSKQLGRLDAWLLELDLAECLNPDSNYHPVDRMCRLGVFIAFVSGNVLAVAMPEGMADDAWTRDDRLAAAVHWIADRFPNVSNSAENPKEIRTLLFNGHQPRKWKFFERFKDPEATSIIGAYRSALEEAMKLSFGDGRGAEDGEDPCPADRTVEDWWRMIVEGSR